MDQPQTYTVISAPREGVNDDVVRVVEWLIEDGGRVEPGTAIVTLETTKATFDVEAGSAGFLFHLGGVGAEVSVGGPLALVSELPQRPVYHPEGAPTTGNEPDGPLITKKARALLERYGLSPADFAGLAVVRAEDVESLARSRGETPDGGAVRTFHGEVLAAATDWDGVLDSPQIRELKEFLIALRSRMKAKFNRHVPTGSLLNDRWELAQDYGFGEGTSVYDECLILGDVKVGRRCWIGPYTVLDGLHAALRIGDFVDIGASAQIYTHNTIERALTGHRAPLFAKVTTIGNCCFIAPQVTIAPGTVIGDHCFVAAGSYVEGAFPPHSYISGNPAKKVGVIEIQGSRARIRPWRRDQAGS